MSDKAKDKAAAPQANSEWVERARLLSEALPYMQRYDKRTIVVKYGGHAMGDKALGLQFARDIVLLKQSGLNPIVVHGGGPQIGAMLTRLGIKSEFSGGLRITDKATVEVVEMVLAGSINKGLVAQLNQAGGTAIGLCGKDGNLIIARKVQQKIHDPESNIEKILDLGFVGEPAKINPEILNTILKSDIIPVIAPVGVSENGDTYNINADTVAGAIAAAMGAARLLLLTDVRGVLDKQGNLVEELTVDQAKALMKDGTISGGMIPKIETCIESVELGVEAVVILDGRVPHAVLLELFTEHGAGTLIQKG
jgi:acetylglutamate kinase